MNYNLSSALKKLEIYNEYEHTLLQLRDNEVHELYDYVRLQEERIKQLKNLVSMLDKGYTNVTKEVEEIDL